MVASPGSNPGGRASTSVLCHALRYDPAVAVEDPHGIGIGLSPLERERIEPGSLEPGGGRTVISSSERERGGIIGCKAFPEAWSRGPDTTRTHDSWVVEVESAVLPRAGQDPLLRGLFRGERWT